MFDCVSTIGRTRSAFVFVKNTPAIGLYVNIFLNVNSDLIDFFFPLCSPELLLCLFGQTSY